MEANGLLHVNFFFMATSGLKKGIGDIQLPYGPVKLGSDCKNCANGGEFDYVAKCICVVDSSLLFKTFGYQSKLKPIERTINILL